MMNKVFPNKIFVCFILLLSYLASPLSKFSATRSIVHRHFDHSSSFNNHSFQESHIIKQQNIDPDEKFLTFFTHSGIQNQLIQVENGILLAWYLNRTLILPRAVLGKAFGWGSFEKLHEQHVIRDKHINCNERIKYNKKNNLGGDTPSKCPDKKKYTLVPFDELFDLSFARQHVKIITRDFSDPNWLEHRLGIDQDQVVYFKGNTRYDWRIFDMPLKNKFLGRYADSLDIDQLRKHNQKLIHFTTLFGTGKFAVKKPEHMEFLEKLGKSITYKHPAVLEVSEKIVQALGGPGNFIGVHLRTSDGLFKNAIHENIEKISKSIERHTHYLSTNLSNQTTTIPSFASSSLSLEKHNLLSQCVDLAKSKQTLLIFLATDASKPQHDAKYNQLYKTTRCIFTLHDILDKSTWNIILDQYRTSHTGESMRKYLIPLVDGLVASRGHSFIGTQGSTFSGYVRRLHNTFWNS